jgi:SET domain-containing protein
MSTFYDTIITPPTIAIAYSSKYSIKSAQYFSPGDIIFENESMLFNPNNITKIQVKFNAINSTKVKTYSLKLDFLTHTVNRGNCREYYGFDSFSNHSCDPNSIVKILGDNKYQVIATKLIGLGEEITRDYETFDSMLDGTVFNCKCGSDNCRKIIRG